jgi:hypothetical protein
MMYFRSLSALSLVVFSCSKGPHPPGGEGEDEFDPGVSDSPDGDDPHDDDEPSDDDTAEPPVEAPESGVEVCYPGADGDYTACFGLVDHTPEMGAAYEYPEPFEGNPQYTQPLRFIDLTLADHSVDLEANFALGELMHEDKGQFGLYQVHAVESLQAVREASGGPLFTHSGYRNVDYNEGVGGAEWSRHMYGDAMDMHSETVGLAELLSICEDLGAGFTKLYSSHVHCDWRDDPLDSVFFEL